MPHRCPRPPGGSEGILQQNRQTGQHTCQVWISVNEMQLVFCFVFFFPWEPQRMRMIKISEVPPLLSQIFQPWFGAALRKAESSLRRLAYRFATHVPGRCTSADKLFSSLPKWHVPNVGKISCWKWTIVKTCSYVTIMKKNVYTKEIKCIVLCRSFVTLSHSVPMLNVSETLWAN